MATIVLAPGQFALEQSCVRGVFCPAVGNVLSVMK